jgi:hypothetical protein
MFSHFSNFALQFLSFGYDNALHFSLYKSFRETSWYPILDVGNWSSDFSLFKSYPSAQAALFSLLSEIFVGGTDDPIRNLSAYFSLVFLVFILTIFLIYRILQVQNNARLQVKISFFISAATVCYAFGGIFLTNGFPPYLFGLFVLLVWLSAVNVNENNHSNIFLLGGLCFFMILNSPALLFCVLFPCAVLVTKELLNLFHEKRFSLLVVRSTYLAGMAIVTLSVNSELSSKFGWRQILAGGGVQPPNIFISSSLSAVVCAVLWMERKSIYRSPLLQVLLSSVLSFVILAVTTIVFTGSIQYYAIKQWYLCLVFISIVVFKFAFQKRSESALKQLSKFMVGIAIVIPATYTNVYAGGYMGTFPKAVAQLLNQDTWAQSPVNSNLHLKLSSSISDIKVRHCVVLRVEKYDSDLNSRWANSLLRTESMSENCFKGYWNSNQLSDTELIDRLSKIDENFIIISTQPVDFKNAATLPNNIELMTVNP